MLPPVLSNVISKTCQNLNFADFGAVGKCLTDVTLFGDVLLMGFIITIMFVLIIFRYNFPITLLFPFGSALMFTMYLMTLSNIFLALFMISVMINGAIFIIGIIGYVSNR
jgi:hypothetical protein